jgi:hypothetical protein
LDNESGGQHHYVPEAKEVENGKEKERNEESSDECIK